MTHEFENGYTIGRFGPPPDLSRDRTTSSALPNIGIAQKSQHWTKKGINYRYLLNSWNETTAAATLTPPLRGHTRRFTTHSCSCAVKLIAVTSHGPKRMMTSARRNLWVCVQCSTILLCLCQSCSFTKLRNMPPRDDVMKYQTSVDKARRGGGRGGVKDEQIYS